MRQPPTRRINWSSLWFGTQPATKFSTRFGVVTQGVTNSQLSLSSCHSCEFFYSALMSSYVQSNSPVRHSRSSGESADRGSSGFDVARRTHQRGHRSGATSRPSQRQCVDSGPLGANHRVFADFLCMYVLLVGFIRFLLD